MSEDQHPFSFPVPENVTTGQLLLILQSMHGQLAELRKQSAADREKLDAIHRAFTNAKGAVAVLKFMALVGGLVAAIYGLYTGLIGHIRGG